MNKKQVGVQRKLEVKKNQAEDYGTIIVAWRTEIEKCLCARKICCE